MMACVGDRRRRQGGRGDYSVIACAQALEDRRLLSSTHHLITFDDLPAGTVVTEQYPGVAFSSDGDANLIEPKSAVGTTGEGSEPNEIGGPAHLTDNLQLDFDRPVDNLKFLVTGISDVGVIGQINVFYGDTVSTTFIVGRGSRVDAVDLSAFEGITRIQIVNITDANGVGYDDFQFDDVSRIIGKVVDADGNGLHGVRVTVSGLSDFFHTDYALPSSDLPSNGNGGFVLGGLDDHIDGSFDCLGVDPSGNLTVSFAAISYDGQSLPPVIKTVTVTPSQFHDGVADLGTIKLDDFKVIDSGGKIRLLLDEGLRNNDDVIMRRATTGDDGKIANSARYQAETRAVTQKLASLGFRENDGTGNGENAPPLIPTSVWPFTVTQTNPTPEERALLLFQTLWFHGGDGSIFQAAIDHGTRTAISGQVDGNTITALNSINGVIWAKDDETAQAQDPNIFTYQTPSSGNRWMHASALRFLGEISHIPGVRALNLNSNSAATGTRPNLGGHAAGSEVDMTWVTTEGGPGHGNFFRPLRNANGSSVAVALGQFGEPLIKTPDGKQREWTEADRTSVRNEAEAIAAGRTWTVQPNYDRKRTALLLDRILTLTSPRISQVIFNDPDFHDSSNPLHIADRRFISVSGHDNHIHVGVVFGREVLQAGTSGAPAWPPVAFTGRSVTTPIKEGGRATLRGTIVDVHNDVFTLQVNWGDGSGTQTYRFPPAAPRAVAVSHGYTHDGLYLVRVSWSSQQANGNSAILSVRVNNVAPTVHAGADATLAAGAKLNRTGFFTDPGPTDSFTATVDYGDGAGPQKLELDPDRKFHLTHQYHHAGQFTVSVRIVDDDHAVGLASFRITLGPRS